MPVGWKVRRTFNWFFFVFLKPSAVQICFVDQVCYFVFALKVRFSHVMGNGPSPKKYRFSHKIKKYFLSTYAGIHKSPLHNRKKSVNIQTNFEKSHACCNIQTCFQTLNVQYFQKVFHLEKFSWCRHIIRREFAWSTYEEKVTFLLFFWKWRIGLKSSDMTSKHPESAKMMHFWSFVLDSNCENMRNVLFLDVFNQANFKCTPKKDFHVVSRKLSPPQKCYFVPCW